MNTPEIKEMVLMRLFDTDKSHRLSRAELKDITKQDDRTSRKYIAFLRNEGHLIMSSPDESGYYMSYSYKDYERLERYFYHKQAQEIRMLGRMKKRLIEEGCYDA